MIDQESLKSIEELHRLKNSGVITEEEFERSKEKLLFGGGTVRRPAASSILPVLRFPQPNGLPAPEDHVGWITLPLRRYADFTGRSTRREFWMFQLVYATIGVVAFLALLTEGEEVGSMSATGTLVFCACFIALLGLLVPQIAVQVRRFHDQDRTGWLAALNLIPYVGAIVVYILMLLEGTVGENRFGPDPLEP